MEQSVLYYSGWFVAPTTSQRGSLVISYVKFYAYDDVDVMSNSNFTIVLESYVIILLDFVVASCKHIIAGSTNIH